MAEQAALSFGGLLRQLRAGALLSQEELAVAAQLSRRSVSDLERGINRTARRDTAVLLAGALGLAEPVRSLFVAAALGRALAAEVLAALQGEAAVSEGLAPGRGPAWPGCPYLGLVPFQERDARVFYGRGELAAQLVKWLAVGRITRRGHRSDPGPRAPAASCGISPARSSEDLPAPDSPATSSSPVPSSRPASHCTSWATSSPRPKKTRASRSWNGTSPR